MRFIAAVRLCLRNYATFTGYATRTEYWLFILFILLVRIVATATDQLLFTGGSVPTLSHGFTLVGPVRFATALGFLPAVAAVQVRRLNDLDMSWAWALLITGPVLVNFTLLLSDDSSRDVLLAIGGVETLILAGISIMPGVETEAR